jgi:hypothetical protein
VRPYFKKPFTKKNQTKKGLVEWLKVKALRSSPSTPKKKKKKERERKENSKECPVASIRSSHSAQD